MTQPLDYQAQHNAALPRRRGKSVFGWVLFIGLAMILFLMLNQGRRQYDPLPLSSFRELLQEDLIASVMIEGDELYGQLKPNSRTPIVNYRTQLPQGTASSWTFTDWLLDHRGSAIVDARSDSNLFLQVLLPLVPWLLIFGFIWFVVSRHHRKAPQHNEPLRVIVVGREAGTTEAGAS